MTDSSAVNVITAAAGPEAPAVVHLFAAGEGFIAHRIFNNLDNPSGSQGWVRKRVEGNIVSLHSGCLTCQAPSVGPILVVALDSEGRIWGAESDPYRTALGKWTLIENRFNAHKVILPHSPFEPNRLGAVNPAPVSGPGYADVFVIDEKGVLKHRRLGSPGEGDWHVLSTPGEVCFVDAAAYYTGWDQVDVFGIDKMGRLFQWTGSGVQSDAVRWTELPNEMDHAPPIAALAGQYNLETNITELFGLGFQEAALYRTWKKGASGQWEDWSYGLGNAPRLRTIQTFGRAPLNLIGLSPAGMLYRTYFDLSRQHWQEWYVNFRRAPHNIKQLASAGPATDVLFALNQDPGESLPRIHVLNLRKSGRDCCWMAVDAVPAT